MEQEKAMMWLLLGLGTFAIIALTLIMLAICYSSDNKHPGDYGYGAERKSRS